jgi:hypothetical protein
MCFMGAPLGRGSRRLLASRAHHLDALRAARDARTMRILGSLLCLVAVSHVAHADTVGPDPNDPGRVTAIRKGVKEIDIGAIFVHSYAKPEMGDAVTQISFLGGIGFQYFINDNFSVGGTGLFNAEKQGAVTSSAFGGSVFASFHVRLGLGAFFRPTAGVGALIGTQEFEAVPGMVTELDQTALLLRVGIPFAYFPSKRIVLQAGPEMNISLGSVTPKSGGASSSFTSIASGFSVGAGYAF